MNVYDLSIPIPLPGVLKTGLANICNFSQLPLSNSLFIMLFACRFFFFFACFGFGISEEVDVERITISPPTPAPPSIPPNFFFVPTHNSLFNTSDSYLKSVLA